MLPLELSVPRYDEENIKRCERKYAVITIINLTFLGFFELKLRNWSVYQNVQDYTSLRHTTIVSITSIVDFSSSFVIVLGVYLKQRKFAMREKINSQSVSIALYSHCIQFRS